MSRRRLMFRLLLGFSVLVLSGVTMRTATSGPGLMPFDSLEPLVVGRNVNMVAGKTLPDGDPYLQRQNEPSGAVSTRNPLHLAFGCNDYRMVDMPLSEGPLPGVPEKATAGDAWLGLFKSYNGGESWINTLLPGHPRDQTAVGRSSPIYGLNAASDPTVRAGANGLFYYSGIAFDRTLHGRSVIFVARFIDNNVTKLGDVDPIKYLDTKIIDAGTSGQFADKPWIAVDVPRSGSDTVPILATGTPVQNVARHSVYMAYSVFLGSLAGGDQSKIMFARSTDCGTTWQSPVKLSESNLINQGTTIAISPKDGTIYVAWRRFGSSSEASSIMVSQSSNFGTTFTRAVAVANINGFDQFSAGNRFRTYAFPTMAVDRDGIAYVAWAERTGPGGDARIVVATSTNGVNWSSPIPVNSHEGRGHQIMPSLTYAAGRLTLTWYDTRDSEGGHGIDISDPGPSGKRHTMDVWVAQAVPSLSPTFSDVNQVSRYLYWVVTDQGGKVPDNPTIIRMENNYPNFTLFNGGLNSFIGDYIDIVPAPRFLFDVDLGTPQTPGSWRFNALDSDPATTFISWADNRDVRPPADGDWMRYNPPTVAGSPTPCTDPTRTGMRNQNIYSSHVTQGLMVGSPVNTKPLVFPNPEKPQKRTFLVFVKNVTENAKQVTMTIQTPPGMQAAFWETWPITDDDWVCPFLPPCYEREITAELAPYTSLTMTVFVEPYPINPYATFRVKVEETGGQGSFLGYIVLNPDPVNTAIVPVTEEYHSATHYLESPANVGLTDPTVLSQSIVYLPNLGNILNFVNPDVVTPAYRSPAYRSGNIVNPAYRSADIGDWPDGSVTDIQWRFTNNNDATSAYSFVPIGDPPSLPEGGTYQLLIYRVSTTPSSGALLNDCSLFQDEHHDLLLKVDSPAFRSPAYRSPAYRSPAYRSPAYRSNTFSLAPGETAVCTLRIIEAHSSSGGGSAAQNLTGLKAAPPSNGFNLGEYAKTIAGAAVSQAPDPDGYIGFSSSLYIIEKELPPASVNDAYAVQLSAVGGTPTSIDNGGTPTDPRDDTWLYEGRWTAQSLSYVSGRPSGLFLDSYGQISGTPSYYADLAYPQALSFVAELTDAGNPAQVAHREFWLTVNCVMHMIIAQAGENGSIYRYGSVPVPHGADETFVITAAACYHIADVVVDGVSKGPVTSYTFYNVREEGHAISAVFAINMYTVTTAADPPGGGVFSPADPNPMTVPCGASQKFIITPNDGYVLKDVLVDGASVGPVTEYTFVALGAVPNHTILAKFQPLESWVRRYNNGAVNGDDAASALAVHRPTGNVYVTGSSEGATTGADHFTLRYNGEGVQGWSAKYDGPAHLGDYATAMAVDAAGNAFVTGYGYRGMVVKHSDYATAKYDATGKKIWDTQYDDRRNGNDEVRAIALDGQGFVTITGRSEDSLSKNDPKHYDYYTIKYNPTTGAQVWAARYNSGLVLNGADEATAIAVDGAGNVYVTGRSQGSAGGFDYATIKYDASGVQKWIGRYDNVGGTDEAAAIAVDGAGNIYVTGRSQGGGTGFDIATVKYDPNGNPQWVKRYNHAAAGGDDEAAAIAVDAGGNVYVAGRSRGGGTDFDFVTIKYDSAGNESWVCRYDYVSHLADEAAAIAVDAAGNVFVTGRSRGGATGFDFLTIKYDGAGKLVWKVRYNNSGVNGDDEAVAIGLDAAGNVFVTGRSWGGATGLDYATIKYKQ